MNKAVEVLEQVKKAEFLHREGWHSILSLGDSSWQEMVENNLPENRVIIRELAQMDSDIEQLQTAINHLKRKVKKDPRVDGLPELNKYLIVWLDWVEMPFIGVYHHGENPYYKEGYWTLADYGSETFRFARTDEILFYADPNEIV